MKPSYDSNENWDIVMEIINDYRLDGEDVLRMLTDWHGLQLLDFDFTENLLTEYDLLDEEEEDEDWED